MIIYALLQARLHEQSVKKETENAQTSLYRILIVRQKRATYQQKVIKRIIFVCPETQFISRKSDVNFS